MIKSEDSVHVLGNIVLVKYQPSSVRTVQYDIDGGRLINGAVPSKVVSSLDAQDVLASKSQLTLYVSTSKTVDTKLAFAKFPIVFDDSHFPIPFEIDVELPNQQRGLLQRADIVLYFFAYVSNEESRITTFIPAGTSQILLQGTNRLVQKLDVYVKMSGIEIAGLFKSRYGQRYIHAGTTFQIRIVSEQSLSVKGDQLPEAVAELTLNNVPAMYPVPFSIKVDYQSLLPNTKYYALGYINENGIQRSVTYEPIWVINEQQVLVTPQVIFTVVPSPFILRGSVTRSMPGSFFIQPHSSLVLRLHQIGSDKEDIIFKLPEITSLPQAFQVNISQSSEFDPTKNYDMRALIMDKDNNIYMASLQPILLVEEITRLFVPVDDLLYYVQCSIQASSSQQLTYIPGSTATILVTESPDAPTKPIFSMHVENIAPDFRDFSIQVPTTAIQRGVSYYLIMMVESNDVITHLSKSLLISNNQPPPVLFQVPVLSLNLISGVLFDTENRPAQWSSSSHANLYLIDDRPENPDKAIVQVWRIHLENDFPVRFDIQLDFSLLRGDGIYRLQAAIEDNRNVLEYKPAASVLAFTPQGGLITDVRIPLHSVKTHQLVKGLIYITDIRGPLPDKTELIIQLSSSPSVSHPSIIDEIHLKLDGLELPVKFNMSLQMNKIDITAIYYFLVSYVVNGSAVIPASQAFAFSPRNEATVIITLSKTPRIPITGQVTSTGSPLILPDDAVMHLYITDDVTMDKPQIYSEVFLQSSPNSLYEFTLSIDSSVIQQKIPLYLRADILYKNEIILEMPRPALLQIGLGGEWNINLVVDLPTLLIGQITSMGNFEKIGGEFEVFVQIVDRDNPDTVVHTSQLRLGANLPQTYRVEVNNNIFVKTTALQARAVIKNCREKVLFQSAGSTNIHAGINVDVTLPVVLTNPEDLRTIQNRVDQVASIKAGAWKLSVVGLNPVLIAEK
jgi:uncharacterized lipoprotein YbaY